MASGGPHIDPPAPPPETVPPSDPAPAPAPAATPLCPAPAGAWVSRPAPTGTLDDFRAYFAAFRAALVGSWTGTWAAWNMGMPVSFSFKADGGYSAHCLASGCSAPLLYGGSDFDTDLKHYRLPTMNFDGVASGSIDLAFGPQPQMGDDPSAPPWIPPDGTTILQNVELDASGKRLRFDLVSYLYKPPDNAHYELWQCP
jgi:hypothetical protein